MGRFSLILDKYNIFRHWNNCSHYSRLQKVMSEFLRLGLHSVVIIIFNVDNELCAFFIQRLCQPCELCNFNCAS